MKHISRVFIELIDENHINICCDTVDIKLLNYIFTKILKWHKLETKLYTSSCRIYYTRCDSEYTAIDVLIRISKEFIIEM